MCVPLTSSAENIEAMSHSVVPVVTVTNSGFGFNSVSMWRVS